MADADIAAADGLAVMLRWLGRHPAVLAECGGDPSRVSGKNEAPYPRWVLRPSDGGDLRGMVWLIDEEVALTTYGDLDGTPGQAALRRLHRIAVGAAAQIIRAPAEVDVPVVTRVQFVSEVLAPEPGTRQPGWRTMVRMRVHPPQAVSAVARLSGSGSLTI